MGGTSVVFSNEALQMLWTFIVCVVNIINLQYEYSISCKLGLYIWYRSNTQEPISFIMHHHQIKDAITL